MAKTSGNFDLASQNWLFYVALAFSIFYALRLFKIAKEKMVGYMPAQDAKMPTDGVKTKEEAVVADAVDDEGLAPKDDLEQVEEPEAIEEKKIK